MISERIVLVGGEVNAVQGLSQLLALEGYLVDAFPESGSACESMAHGRPGAVIVDVDPSGALDVDLVASVRSASDEGVSLILVTSRADADPSRLARESGVSAILAKPIKFSDLMAILRGSGTVE